MELKSFTIKNDWLPLSDIGWGNGYVIIPEGHPDHGKEYDQIGVNIHGGLTFGVLGVSIKERLKKYLPKDITVKDTDYVVGFDTAHYQDNKYNCSETYVLSETASLKKQLENRYYKFSDDLSEFLDLYDIKNLYLINLSEQRTPQGTYIDALGGGFLFCRAFEGHEFWEKYNIKWHKFLNIKKSMEELS